MPGAQSFTVNKRNFCVLKRGRKSQAVGTAECKDLNAKLPIPTSQAEINELRKIYVGWIWLGISDPSSSGVKDNWKDINGEKPAFIQLWILNLYYLVLYFFLILQQKFVIRDKQCLLNILLKVANKSTTVFLWLYNCVYSHRSWSGF